ncbi:MAG TPA: arginine--tRNA ligase [Bacteroidales bacterium]|nr:arginine--tRNA ligase [Bacteroidales bacterium]
MNETHIIPLIVRGFREIYQGDLQPETITLQRTRRDVPGDLTLVVFPLAKMAQQAPEATARALGDFLLQNNKALAEYEVVKGFLNLTFKEEYWLGRLADALIDTGFGHPSNDSPRRIVIEYSSPNTNKPLHLGHIRNNLLGFSLSRLMQANGHEVIKVNLVNDRGIHICKSMLAWKKWGNGETPVHAGLKGDHLVGKYYVLFDLHFRQEVSRLKEIGHSDEEVQQLSPLMQEAREMLRQWENGDEEVKQLWSTMNAWVYDGFDATYQRLGVDFDKIYYESETYQLGKRLVEEGVRNGAFYRRDDGSVWADLTADGLDEKLLLRSDGTSVYMTQDLGTAQLRHDDYQADELVYVVGNEQNYHFDVLARLLARLGRPWAGAVHHYSYGMVELPQGRMKSREGTVVDADDLMEEMEATARSMSESLGKLEGMDTSEAARLHRMIGLAALKYYMLKVDPKKTMLFNPEESVDFNGNTGPFIQYTHARICSVFRKAGVDLEHPVEALTGNLDTRERGLLKSLLAFPEVIREAGQMYSPALVANYVYELAREFNQFYQEHSILQAESEEKKALRLALSAMVARNIREGMFILGIEVPDRM